MKSRIAFHNIAQFVDLEVENDIFDSLMDFASPKLAAIAASSVRSTVRMLVGERGEQRLVAPNSVEETCNGL